jgi:hypothetical protein
MMGGRTYMFAPTNKFIDIQTALTYAVGFWIASPCGFAMTGDIWAGLKPAQTFCKMKLHALQLSLVEMYNQLHSLQFPQTVCDKVIHKMKLSLAEKKYHLHRMKLSLAEKKYYLQ